MCCCCCLVAQSSVMSDSLWPPGLQPARLLCPWDSPGKNTGVGCCALLQGIFPTKGSNLGLRHCRQTSYRWATRETLLMCYHRSEWSMWGWGPRPEERQSSAEREQSCCSLLCGQALEWLQWKAWGLEHDLMETSWSLRFPAEVTPQGSWIAGPPPWHHIFSWVLFIAWLNLASQSWSLGSDCGPLSVTTPQDLAWPWDPSAPWRVSVACTWRGSMSIFTTCYLWLRFLVYKMTWYLKIFILY